MINKLNKISLPIIMVVTLIFSLLRYVESFLQGDQVEALGLFIQVILILVVAFLAYLKKMYSASIIVISFKLIFIEGQAFIRLLLSNYQPDFSSVEPYFNIWAMVMFFYIPFLLIQTLIKDKKAMSTLPYTKFINVSAMFVFLTLFVGPEAALFAVIPTCVCLLYNLELEPDILFLAAVVKVPFQMTAYMLDTTKEITLFYGLYWTVGIIFVVYGLFLTVNTIIKFVEKKQKPIQA